MSFAFYYFAFRFPHLVFICLSLLSFPLFVMFLFSYPVLFFFSFLNISHFYSFFFFGFQCLCLLDSSYSVHHVVCKFLFIVLSFTFPFYAVFQEFQFLSNIFHFQIKIHKFRVLFFIHFNFWCLSTNSVDFWNRYSYIIGLYIGLNYIK